MSRILRRVARKQINILGVDPSLRSTGYAYRTADGQLVTGTIDPGELTGPFRLFYIRKQMQEIIAGTTFELVIYEDYAMGMHGNVRSQFEQAELGGILKTLFWENKINVMLVAPKALKKAITGRGDADSSKRVGKDKTKPEMRAALLQTFKIALSQNDEADACGLMLIGELQTGCSNVAPEEQRKLKLDSLSACVTIRGRGNKLQLIAQ